ncbi:HSP90-domain-containing protein [Coprinopsis marcescibilis]|uniref:HSP90-domain-containing protein n=1 Tax=Coprinopsis marcescibilis TaxID=230819 RepID=A0A5C3L9S2_COPMA|nr:HSP90-domain-containing protein [Coprinopsis marcescibilis]
MPPLPPGWTQHLGPGGQLYYHHAQTQQSTYVRPLPTYTVPAPTPTQPKKEKAHIKTAIPGTDWLRVTTTEGNIFYSNKTTKQSSWVVPPEIAEAVMTFDQAPPAATAPPSTKSSAKTNAPTKDAKRKIDEVQAIDEFVAPKKAKILDDEEDDFEDSSEDEEEEEEWQREAADQLAKEAEEFERIRKEEEEEAKQQRLREDEESRKQNKNGRPQLNMPAKVDLSIEEAKALFKTLLREKDINPLHPWDTCLPLFISDPRYVLLPSVAARREAFDDYCRERARELRDSVVKKDKAEANPKDEFDRLLMEEVKSTRASWTDFRRTWKKDRRFYGWGRDEREREKAFRDYLKQLGEKKKAAARKAEQDFFTLLKEHEDIKAGDSWKDKSKSLYSDPRYDAVGSSSLREELFNTFIKNIASTSKAEPTNTTPPDAVEKESKELRRDRALKEREQQVKVQQDWVSTKIAKSRIGMNQEEGERTFNTMLVDAIRDPQTNWDTAIEQLRIDPRFINSPLSQNIQVKLFHAHIAHLRIKHLSALHSLFEENSPSLKTKFEELPISSFITSQQVVKLGYDIHQLEGEYNRWQRERYTEARRAFDEMLTENSFVEFWGRLSKMKDVTLDQGLQVTSEDIGEDDEPVNQLNMKALAQSVDIGEMVKVLKRDRRYAIFDCSPEDREKWLRVRRPLHFLLSFRYFNSAAWLPERTKMRFLATLVLSLTLLSSYTSAQDAPPNAVRQDYQSDVARLRKIVINSLYSHKEIFLRELISNANDALEKLRISSLKDKSMWNGSDLNITIKAIPGEDGKSGQIIITDTGIGMSPEELATNLGTLAKSGTSDFVKKVDTDGAGGGNGNLIGAFGLGFYSSFLVADRVEVASIPPRVKDGQPAQYVFSSSADESAFDIYPDPRGNSLGRGTEIKLFLKPDALQYLDTKELARLIHKHSAFSSSFPLYLWETRTEEVPDEEAAAAIEASKAAEAESTSTENTEAEPSETATDSEPKDEDAAVVEDVIREEEQKPFMPPTPPPTKNVTIEEWTHINSQPPLWSRDPKSISDCKWPIYEAFYTGFFKDFGRPLAWHHFSAESGDGTPFKAIIFLPEKLPDQYWEKPLDWQQNDVKLLVKRTFITSDLAEHSLPKWANWVKVVVDADDLPLNVSRETLQSNRFLKDMRGVIIKRLIQLFKKIEKEEPKKWEKLQKTYGSILKLGAVQDTKNRDKLASLCRFTTNQRNETSYDMYVDRMRQGQSQIFYIAEMGKQADELSQSIFIEKLVARGYEVLLLMEPLDEMLFGSIREWKKIPFQDVAKAGLKFGDEDPEEEARREAELNEKFQPLINFLKARSEDIVKDVVLSNRLVKSPCAIVADNYGYTANVQKMMSASNHKRGDLLHEFAIKAKRLEINPHSPLIEGLLRRVRDLPTDDDDYDEEAENELKEVAYILIDGALVRSGFEVVSKNDFFNRVDKVLRRSLGVSERADSEVVIEPAPPIAAKEEIKEDIDDGKPRVILPDDMKDKVSIEMEEIDDDDLPVFHDEL